MLISEFIDRTGYRPTAEEYADIEEAYYVFDGNKDAYCKAWVKANPHKAGRIWAAQKEQTRLEKVFNNVLRYVLKVKVAEQWWYDLTFRQWQEYCETMCVVTKCKDRKELRTMVLRLEKSYAVTGAWTTNRKSFLNRLSEYV